MSSLRRARSLKQRAGLHERAGDYPKAAQDLVDALDEPENPYQADCHRALAEVLWMSPGADERVKKKALQSVEAAARVSPDYVEKFAAFLINRTDEDGLILLARHFVAVKDVRLPSSVRVPMLRFAATAGRRRNVEPKERLDWLNEALGLKDGSGADDEALADLHSMRGIILNNLGRFADAKRDLQALQTLVDRHANDSGAWQALRKNALNLKNALSGK